MLAYCAPWPVKMKVPLTSRAARSHFAAGRSKVSGAPCPSITEKDLQAIRVRRAAGLISGGRFARFAGCVVHPVHPVGPISQFLGHIGEKAGGGQGAMIAYEPKSLNGMEGIVEDDVAIGSAKAERIDRDPS
ncbi:MAG: hypothetical protein Q9225_005622 [Loekoesia sp. 1 TL-2023]